MQNRGRHENIRQRRNKHVKEKDNNEKVTLTEKRVK